MQTANHLLAGFNIPKTIAKNIFAKGVQRESFMINIRVNYAGPWTYVQQKEKNSFSIPVLFPHPGPATFHGSDQLISLLREILPAHARHP